MGSDRMKFDSSVSGGGTVPEHASVSVQTRPGKPTGGQPRAMNFGSPEAIGFTKGLVVSTLFAVLICLPALDWAFHLDHAPIPNEKRRPAPFPDFRGLAQTRDFLSGLTAWFDD